jgi:hypothetical protein
MSEVFINTNTKEEVAYKLMARIAKSERILDKREDLLKLYAECLVATSGNRPEGL